MSGARQEDSPEPLGSVSSCLNESQLKFEIFFFFFIIWYLAHAVRPTHAILNSCHAIFQFGTLRNDPLKQKGKDGPCTLSGESVFHATSKPSRWCGSGCLGPA